MDEDINHYDQDNTIFSPDGRLFQVEYARETIKKGATCIGIKYKNGVLILSYKNKISYLIENKSTDKIIKINNNICCAFVGITSDALHLINYAHEEIASNLFLYDEQLNVKTLVKNICEYKHIFTTYYGLRPFGVVLIIAGIDPIGIHLFSTDPSGAFLGYKAICEGKKSSEINNYLTKNYKENLSLNNAIKLSLKSLKHSLKINLSIDNIEIGIIENKKIFKKIEKDELKKYREFF